jgi:hypothetical protein
MKQFQQILFIFVTTLSIYSATFGQVSCDEIKKENEYLRKALKVTTPVKTVTSTKIDFNILTCTGNTKEQTVQLILTLVNHDVSRDISFSEITAVDIEANEYKTYRIKIGSGGSNNKVYTDVPIKTIITFKEVLPGIKLLKLIAIPYYDSKASGGKAEFEYKDIPITWQ